MLQARMIKLDKEFNQLIALIQENSLVIKQLVQAKSKAVKDTKLSKLASKDKEKEEKVSLEEQAENLEALQKKYVEFSKIWYQKAVATSNKIDSNSDDVGIAATLAGLADTLLTSIPIV